MRLLLLRPDFYSKLGFLPKENHCDFTKGINAKEESLANLIKNVLMKIKIGLDNPAYAMVINTSPYRRDKSANGKWKTIHQDYCWHIEITPRLTHVAGFEKGTGFFINSAPPEYTTEYLKEVPNE